MIFLNLIVVFFKKAGSQEYFITAGASSSDVAIDEARNRVLVTDFTNAKVQVHSLTDLSFIRQFG